jgi:hypothetical protein
MYVDEKKSNERLNICKNCSNLKDEICLVCGCQVNQKCTFKYEKCPIGKW